MFTPKMSQLTGFGQFSLLFKKKVCIIHDGSHSPLAHSPYVNVIYTNSALHELITNHPKPSPNTEAAGQGPRPCPHLIRQQQLCLM